MHRGKNRNQSARWRVVLEARWRARLREVTELSVAYHGVAAPQGPDDRRARRLLSRAVAARQRLADTEAALGRLTSGDFGRCEQCGEPIPAGQLAVDPETRYCPGCGEGPGTTRWPATAGSGR
jgi:RNA polymerase-binding transcription factor DksA